MSVIIEAWQPGSPEHRQAFADLNREWLNEFFRVELADEAMFADPQSYIIDKGGDIFFARLDGRIVGTVGLIKMEDGTYELAKMGVTSAVRGHGVGRQLAEALIAGARRRNARRLYIASNRKLAQAITLYKKLGFKELPEPDMRYERADITLELLLAPEEIGGCKGLEPTRYGDWERAGKCVDF